MLYMRTHIKWDRRQSNINDQNAKQDIKLELNPSYQKKRNVMTVNWSMLWLSYLGIEWGDMS